MSMGISRGPLVRLAAPLRKSGSNLRWRGLCLEQYHPFILWMRPANERRRYIVTSSPIDGAHTQNGERTQPMGDDVTL